MEKQPSHALNLTGAFADSKRIIVASYTHYLALSVFYFPVCATVTFPFLANLNANLMKELSNSNLDQKTVIYLIICIILVYIITVCDIATITYSTHHCVLGDPSSLLTILKSLKCTFFPLFFTSFVAAVLVVLITLTFLVSYGLVLMLGQTLGFVNSYDNYFWFSLVLHTVIFGVIVGVIITKWSLAYVVGLAESKWGFSALKRSWHLFEDVSKRSLKKGLKYDILSGICIFCGGIVPAAVVYVSWSLNWTISDLSFILLTVFGSFFLMMGMLMKTVDDSVFYNYLKAFHDELPVKIDQGYVHPSTDVKKVPRVVNVATA
ncbi:hypothetical protein CTI12_AA261870 [Artemisia annua]|uniref:Uncharacterized protein n=1 Tax=Artemisia annua TaxID=35608 RepID=A0A2U1NIK1_ARTAN|nr:hypothetical protein CTI12_AA261870 [Artemisia annua]